MKPGEPGVGLALSGGAARCAAHIGVLEVLEEAELPIAGIAGTSGGALIGALYAAGWRTAALASLARETRWRKMARVTLPRTGFLDSRKIGAFVRALIGDLMFEQLQIPLAIVATDLQDGSKVVLTTGSVALAVQASCSLPVIFTPTRLDGRLLVDGGAVSQLPALAVREALGVPFVVAVDVNCGALEEVRLTNLLRVAVHFVALFARRNAQAERAYADLVIEVDARNTTLYDLDKAGLMMERGRHAARRRLAELRERLSHVSERERGRPCTSSSA